ncbi:MAG: hypothetical protein DMF83_30950 [Acidobacteria bacterium]|nr:MAG: hypothetical protein DMF83_30950 [Acidobacteriota bacterium]
MHCSTMLRSPRTPKPSAVYHVVFDETLQPWKVDLVDGFGRQVRHDRRRVGRNTIPTVRPSEAEHRAGDIADYPLVFRADRGITPGTEYTIRAQLETSDNPVPTIARRPR